MRGITQSNKFWPDHVSYARADQRWTFSGIPVVILDNAWMRVVVAPSVGSHILSLEYRPRSHEWLWRNPRIPLTPPVYGAEFDAYWSGGIDAFFPTCYPSVYDGTRVPEGGDVWSIPWEAHPSSDHEGCTVTLKTSGRVWPAEFERTLKMWHDKPVLQLTFSMRNVGLTRLPFLFGLHPSLAIEKAYRLDLPPGTVRVDEVGGRNMGTVGQTFEWPFLPDSEGSPIDMRMMRARDDNSFGGHFFTPHGEDLWWALTDRQNKMGIGLVAPGQAFRGLWLWQVFGGWRGYHHLVAEPWTGYPITLEEAVSAGNVHWVEPSQTMQVTIQMVCYEAVSAVSKIGVGGVIEPEPDP